VVVLGVRGAVFWWAGVVVCLWGCSGVVWCYKCVLHFVL